MFRRYCIKASVSDFRLRDLRAKGATDMFRADLTKVELLARRLRCPNGRLRSQASLRRQGPPLTPHSIRAVCHRLGQIHKSQRTVHLRGAWSMPPRRRTARRSRSTARWSTAPCCCGRRHCCCKRRSRSRERYSGQRQGSPAATCQPRRRTGNPQDVLECALSARDRHGGERNLDADREDCRHSCIPAGQTLA